MLYYDRPTNVTGAPDFFFTYLSGQSGGVWGYLILLMVFSISYLALSEYNARQAFAGSSFITFITTVLLLPFEVVSSYALLLTGLAVVMALVINRPDNPGGVNI